MSTSLLSEGRTARELHPAARIVRRDRLMIVLAGALLFGEATCGALVPHGDPSAPALLWLDGDGRVEGHADLASVDLDVRSGSLAVIDDVFSVLGRRERTGAQKVGTLIGIAILAIPPAIVFVALLGAWLRPAYYRRQRGWDGRSPWTPSRDEFRAVLGISILGSAISVAGMTAGALPGLFALLLAGALESGPLAWVGLLLLIGGGIGGALYAHLGWLWADRIAVLEGVAAREAIRRAWRAADRKGVFGYWLAYAVLDTAGMLAWTVIGPFALLVHAPLRALGDTLLTRGFLASRRA
jgi:hypothetical protein